jgi:hypothetical protein
VLGELAQGPSFYLPRLTLALIMAPSGEKRFPVVLIPGLGGSALEARYKRTSGPRSYCHTDTDW